MSSNLEVLISLGFKKGEIDELDNVIKKLRELEAKGVKLADVTTKAESQKESRDTRKTMEDIKESLFKQKVETDNTAVLESINKISSNINQLEVNLFAHGIFPKASNEGLIKSMTMSQQEVEAKIRDFSSGKSDKEVPTGNKETYIKQFGAMMYDVILNTQKNLSQGMPREKLESVIGLIQMFQNANQGDAFFSHFNRNLAQVYGGREDRMQAGYFGVETAGRKIIRLPKSGVNIELQNTGYNIDNLTKTPKGYLEGKELIKTADLQSKLNLSRSNKELEDDIISKIDEFLPIKEVDGKLQYTKFDSPLVMSMRVAKKARERLKQMGVSRSIIKLLLQRKRPDAAFIQDPTKRGTVSAEESAKEYMEAIKSDDKEVYENILHEFETLYGDEVQQHFKEYNTNIMYKDFAKIANTSKQISESLKKNAIDFSVLSAPYTMEKGYDMIKAKPNRQILEEVQQYLEKKDNDNDALVRDLALILGKHGEDIINGVYEKIKELKTQQDSDRDKISPNGG